MTGTSGSGGFGEAVRGVVGKVHGTGEAIRGKALAALDDVAGDRASAAKNEQIANKGVDEFQHGYRSHGTNAGVAPVDADRERLNTTHSASTNYGPHSTNVGNKLDPRFDSDNDHRGTATTSTNVGTHSTNIGNKLDPRFDSDADHRADPLSSIGGTGAGAGSTNVGPHSTNIGNKLDPRFDSDADHRANPASAAGGNAAGSTNVGPHSSNIANKLDPRVDPDADHRANPGSAVGGAGYGTHDQVHAAHCPHEHRGSIGASSGLKAAQKLDPLYEASEASMKYAALSSIHTHRGSVGGASGLEAAEKLDPPEHVRGLEYEQPKPDYHQLTPVYENSFLDMPEVEGESTEDAWKRVVAPATPRFDDRFGKQSNFLEQGEMDEQIEPTCRKSDPAHVGGEQTKPMTSKCEARSTANPQKSEFLNLLDPSIDRPAVKKQGDCI